MEPQDTSQPDPRVAYFDRLAAEWDASDQNAAETIRRLEESADLLRLKPGEAVLEVGCGTGQLTGWLAARVRPDRVVAIDFSPGMLEKAGPKCAEAEFRLVDICRDPVGEGCFDLAFCFHSFPHFHNQSTALQNLGRALKPTGRLVILHFAGSGEISRLHADAGGPVARDRLPPPDEWEGLLSLTGLHLVEMIDRPGLFYLRASRQL
jgi:ubiquinone/menaquinone biosynthesis C-methylase UbiE